MCSTIRLSTQEIPYAEALKKIINLETQIKDFTAAKKGEEDKTEDKEMEATFKQAQNEMKDEEKEHMATNDDMEKVKDAFKKAQDESDPEKKKDAMKKAMEMKDEHDKKEARKYAKKGEEIPKENVNKDKEHEAKIASIVMKKIPLMQKILEATKIMDISNYDKIEKQLEGSTLEEVQKQYDTLAPYMAVIGAGKPSVSRGQMGMVPFQASSVINSDNPTDIFSASVDDIDFSKVSTKQIQEMYQ